jgi:hypothetical protein
VFDYDIHSSNDMSQHSGMDSITIWMSVAGSRLQLKCDGIFAETRFRLSAKQTCPFKSVGAYMYVFMYVCVHVFVERDPQ